MMTPISFLATTNSDSAIVFYRDSLGFKLIEDTPFAIVFERDGAMLRIQKVESFDPHPFTALGWQVDDIAASCAELTRNGIVFERYNFLQMGDSDIWSAPDGAKVCWFKDPDGNTLSLTEFLAS